ncbi:helix-turn-helix transcriptional regulator [Hyphomicrobium sp. CS1BSMeth3]|uniref:helix-turn-helix transcriptional regulator n=1 Tax=Hyphomicrobium sp. CS1BSMeth3 TaxID=1892844 RepID=UPI0009305660|nr:helix-turn-helix transcriptional regulator [Hyphomicrobium sp. CS1BSMeth3]
MPADAPRKKATRKLADNPFFAGVQATIAEWIENEWTRREALLTLAQHGRWTEEKIATELANVTLTPEHLASAIDNISLSKLRRELHKIGAPSPGQLIREARLAYAKRLLIETRLMIREVRERAGYEDEDHFVGTFMKDVGMTPTEFRRRSTNAT